MNVSPILTRLKRANTSFNSGQLLWVRKNGLCDYIMGNLEKARAKRILPEMHKILMKLNIAKAEKFSNIKWKIYANVRKRLETQRERFKKVIKGSKRL